MDEEIKKLTEQLSGMALRFEVLQNEEKTQEQKFSKKIQSYEERLNKHDLEKEVKEGDLKLINLLEKRIMKYKKKIELNENEISHYSKKTQISGIRRKINRRKQELEEITNFYEGKIKSLNNEWIGEKDNVKDHSNQLKLRMKSHDYLECVKNSRRHTLEEYISKSKEMEKSDNILSIAQACAEVMKAIYKDIVEDYFKYEVDGTPKKLVKQPHLYDLKRKVDLVKRNIQTYHQTVDDKKQAQESWEYLKNKMGLDLIMYMEMVIDERNLNAAHPDFSEREMVAIAEKLQDQEEKVLLKKLISFTKETFEELFAARL